LLKHRIDGANDRLAFRFKIPRHRAGALFPRHFAPLRRSERKAPSLAPPANFADFIEGGFAKMGAAGERFTYRCFSGFFAAVSY